VLLSAAVLFTVTTAFRAIGSQIFELGGLNEDEVDKTGCWNQTIKAQCYKNNVSMPAVRFAAGLRVPAWPILFTNYVVTGQGVRWRCLLERVS
jgi:hypothetical protein